MAACKHCKRSKAVRPRGLCWKCYYNAAVRNLYPVNEKFGRGVPDVDMLSGHRLPVSPTTTEPGTSERIAVLAERFAEKRALFHPDDVTVKKTKGD